MRKIIDHNLHLYIDIRSILKNNVDIIENDEDEIFKATEEILRRKMVICTKIHI